MLTGPQIRQIQAALLSAFPSKDALAMMTRLELEQNLEAIAGGENLSVVIFKLVSWAETHHRIPDLIQGATRHNPGNAALQQLAREAATWVTVTPPAEITGTQPLIQAADPPTAIDIFLSYSRLDSALMRRLYADLRGAGFSVWIDEGLEPGTPSWQRAVEEAIETAKCVVVILSPDAKQSKWVEIEVSYAEEIGLRIFPVLARGDERNAVLFRLRTTQRVDIRRQYEKVTVELLPTLQRRLRFDVAAPAPAASPIDFDWVTIPAGEFLMGSDKQRDKQALDRELPQHTRYLPEYRIARAPVTVAQFTAFVEATGYKTTAEVKGSAYVWTGTQWEEVKGADWAHPRGPASNVLQKQTHPVTVVSWHDALVFCRWAGVRLPSEMEWEKAARGVDGRIWPWGDQAPTRNHCNFNRHVGDTSPVGRYPDGASPYGVLDMAGNVWEWCSTAWLENYEDYPAQANDDLAGDAPRVVRGGSWTSTVPACAVRSAAGASRPTGATIGVFGLCPPASECSVLCNHSDF